MDALNDLLMFLGSSVCHQIAERTFTFGDEQMPMCARCMGIHVGFLVSAVLLWAGGVWRASSFPSVRAMVVLGALMAVGAADALLSYSGLIPSDNLRRVLSGAAMGTAVPYFVVPLLNMTLFPGRDPRSLLSVPQDWLRLASAYGVTAVAILVAPSAYASFVVVSVVGIVGLFATFTSIVMSILALAVPRLRARWLALASVALATSMLLLMAVSRATFLPEV